MSQPKSKATDWAALLQRELNKKTKEPVGPGWETFEEILKRTGWGVSKASSCLRSAVKSGAAERFDGSHILENGKIGRCTWYREIK